MPEGLGGGAGRLSQPAGRASCKTPPKSKRTRCVRDALRTGDGWIQVSVALILIAAVVTAVAAVTRRVWPPLLVYGLIALFLVLGQNGYYHSKPRLLVPVLIVLVPPALALARARCRTAALVLVGYALFGLWYGAYLITVWRFAI